MPTVKNKKKKEVKKKTKREQNLLKKGKILDGTVSSIKMDKTVVVTVTRKSAHPIYKKVLKTSKRYKARALKNVSLGSKVQIIQTKPYAKNVHWKVMKVIEK